MSFFFQAEDGIRDHCVTGVQTCALPIFRRAPAKKRIVEAAKAVCTLKTLQREPTRRLETKSPTALTAARVPKAMPCCSWGTRSEERRVGKEWRCRGCPSQ